MNRVYLMLFFLVFGLIFLLTSIIVSIPSALFLIDGTDEYEDWIMSITYAVLPPITSIGYIYSGFKIEKGIKLSMWIQLFLLFIIGFIIWLFFAVESVALSEYIRGNNVNIPAHVVLGVIPGILHAIAWLLIAVPLMKSGLRIFPEKM